MRRMFVDIETYSSVDLTKSGVYPYAKAPDFAVLLIAYSFEDEEEVHLIDCVSCSLEDSREYKKFVSFLRNPEIMKEAYNANFERTCLAEWVGFPMPPEEWEDTMVQVLECGLPLSLADSGAALGLPKDKLKDPQGKALINYFSKPCKHTKANGGRTRNLPAHDLAKWELFGRYCRQDVVTEKEIARRLKPYRIPESEWDLWRLDQEMNDRGVRIDVEMARKIVGFDAERGDQLQDEAKEITGLENPNSIAQLKEWLGSRGFPTEKLAKDNVEELLAGDLPEDVRRVLEIRQALGKTSVKKYSAMLEGVCPDGRIRGVLQFYGANRSGRWTGRLVQVHNLAKNTLPDLDLARELASSGKFDELETLFGEPSFIFSELVRTAFIPSEGCRFVVSDFSAIEARVISWLSGEAWRQDAFAKGKDIYCETASQMYGVPVVKHGENGELRQKGKIAELALGYQGGVGALKVMDSSGSVPEEEMQDIVDKWRAANPKVVHLWGTCDNAAKTVIRKGGLYAVYKGVKFSYINGNLFITLPSGRKLCYWDARLEKDARGWGDKITYGGVNQTTKKWERVDTYGGKLVENIVQAIARDCLAEVIKRVSAEGYKIVMHVHDEIIVDVPVEDEEAPGIITAIMGRPISWAPGLLLKGETYETAFYKKD